MENQYKEQAQKFCDKNGVKMSIELAKVQSAPLWAVEGSQYGLKYNIKIERADRKWDFSFWGSVHDKENRKKPTAYDVLACITKNETGSFQNFCDDYGYDTDSRKALETFLAVGKEWENCERLFGDVIEELQEIN
jgi:hypothetical protein